MKRRLNLRFLGILLGTVAVLAVSGHFLRAYQVKRTAGNLLAQAQRARDAGELEDAAQWYERYLLLEPVDADALAQFGLVLDKLAKSPGDRHRVFYLLDRSLQLNDDQENVRRHIVHVAMAIGLWSDAQDHLAKLLQHSPNDGELEHLLALSLEGAKEYDKAAVEFEKAISDAPQQIDSYVHLAELWRHHPQFKKQDKANALMERMVETNDTFEAYLARCRYFRTGGSGAATVELPGKVPTTSKPVSALNQQLLALGTAAFGFAGTGTEPGSMTAVAMAFANRGTDLLFKAEHDAAIARDKAPDDAEVLLESAEVARACGWLSRAERFARRGLDLHPKDVRMYKMVAALAVHVGRRPEAVALLKKGVKELPQEADLLFVLAEMLIEERRFDEVAPLKKRLKDLHLHPDLLAYLDAHVQFANEDWLEAARTLEKSYATFLSRHSNLARQAAVMLGKCYEQLGDFDQQFRNYQRARGTDVNDPIWLAATDGIARAQLGLNQIDLALSSYGELLVVAPGARFLVARLLLIRNLLLPERQREWKELDQHLAIIAQQFPRSAEEAILRAQVLAAQARYDEAFDLMKAAQEENPREILLWVARAGLESAKHRTPKSALAILDEAERILGDHIELRDQIELRLARIRFELQGDVKEAPALLAKLEIGAEKFSPADRQRLYRALADAYTALGEGDRARRIWEELAREKHNDLGIWISLYDLALQSHDDDRLEKIRKEMERIEGIDGPLVSYARAAHIINSARRGKKQDLDPARKLLLRVANRRPNWARVPVLEAQIALLGPRGDTSTALAITRYQRAIELGERSPLVLLETIQLLRQSGRHTEAFDIIRMLPEQTPLLDQINSAVVDLALRNKDLSRAKIQAEKAVAANPRDYRNHLSLAQVYGALERPADAETSLRNALEQANGNPETWVALVFFLAKTQRTPEAQATIRAATEKLPEAKNRLAYAQCFEAVGQKDQAERLYTAAVKADPNKPGVLGAAAGFALRAGKVDEARKYLFRIIDQQGLPKDETASARRLLGLILTTDKGDYIHKQKMLAELGYLNRPAEEAVNESAEDKRTRAVILAAQRRRKDREEAIKVLEGIHKMRWTTSDLFLMAQLHESLGRWPRAVNLVEEALIRERDNPRYLAYLAAGYLSRPDEALKAEPYVARLERSQGDAWRTVSLRARLLHAQKKDAEAVALIVKQTGDKEAPTLLAAALLLEQMEQKPAAEKLFEKYEKKSTRPEAALARAGFLGRTGRLAEALDLYDQARTKNPAELLPGILTLAMEVLYAAKPDPADLKRVEGWIEVALLTCRQDPRQLLAVRQVQGALLNLQERFKESRETYELCLRDDPNNALARNNLAWLLATKGEQPEKALDYIQRAIELAGPSTALLDTRGIVYLAMGNTDLAFQDLEEVALDEPTAVSFFHLAQACHARAQDKDALAALKRAIDLGLKDRDLHPFERDKYPQLRAALGMN